MDSELLKSLVGLGGIPIILALTQLFKPWINDTRLYPFISVAWALAINIGLAIGLGGADRVVLMNAAFLGTMAGLAGSGLYSSGATFREGTLADKSKRPDSPPSPPARQAK